MEAAAFHEAATLSSAPIRALNLSISGTWLEPVVQELLGELQRLGIVRVRPRFYLSTEWGVPFNTIAVAIPFYLARPELIALHKKRAGHVEGFDRSDILRYLRHEVGHVLNYAYRLYDDPAWVKLFGPITRPYQEDYRVEPFSRRYVRHLPGWYAQRHPDEDWSETFAVWMTPNTDWRVDYSHWPEALAKLEYCDRCMATLRDRDPIVTSAELDEDVNELEYSLDKYYEAMESAKSELPPGLDAMLNTIFYESAGSEEDGHGLEQAAASALMHKIEAELVANVYHWTGHFPERTRSLLRGLSERADALHKTYSIQEEFKTIIALTAFVTALAMNYVRCGSYLP